MIGFFIIDTENIFILMSRRTLMEQISFFMRDLDQSDQTTFQLVFRLIIILFIVVNVLFLAFFTVFYFMIAKFDWLFSISTLLIDINFNLCLGSSPSSVGHLTQINEFIVFNFVSFDFDLFPAFFLLPSTQFEDVFLNLLLSFMFSFPFTFEFFFFILFFDNLLKLSISFIH